LLSVIAPLVLDLPPDPNPGSCPESGSSAVLHGLNIYRAYRYAEFVVLYICRRRL